MGIFSNTICSIPLVICVLFTSAAALFSGCPGKGEHPAETRYNIPYGSDPRNTFDLSLPAGRTMDTPVIILVHGGAWTGGDKSDFNYLRGYFCKRGFAVVSMNYRLARTRGSGFNNMLNDVEAVIAYMNNNSRSLIFAKDTVFIAGHSAGGHVALLYAFIRNRGRSVRGVVSFCGVTDLTDPDLKTLLGRLQSGTVKPGEKSFDLIEFITGGNYKTERMYSPVHVTADVPVLLFCGEEDTIIPYRQSVALHDKMKSKGYNSTLYVYPDMGHDITPHYGEIMTITEEWIRKRVAE